MSQVSERSRDESDNRSKQSSTVGPRRGESPSASQQRSSSQIEHSEGSGGGERQSNVRRTSTSNSDSTEGPRPNKTIGRPEASKKSSSKQKATEGAKAYVTTGNNSHGASGGAYNVGGGAYNVGGGAYNVGGGAYNVGGGAYNVGGGAFNVGGGAYNVGSGAYNTGVTGGSFNVGGDSYSISSGTPVTGERRKGRFRQEQIRLPDQAQGQVRQVRQRLPTPEPDTIERTFIQRTAAEIVEEITEIPTTPPPIVKERTVVEPAGPPQVHRRKIRVPPRSGGYQQQLAGGAQFDFGSLGTTQQLATGYQQQGATTHTGGFSGAAVSGVPNYFGSYQQQAPANFATGQNQVAPPPGCQPAFCYYL